MNKAALVGWLTVGSKKDMSALVGTLDMPCLVMAGTEEKALGPEAQREHTLPHLPNATLVSLEGGGHLAPLERPHELVLRIVAFVGKLLPGFQTVSDPLSPESRELILSARTSEATRAVLLKRLAEDELQAPTTLTEEEIFILRSIADRVVPGCSFDLALRIDRWLALPNHDGWRPDRLPPDLEAWHLGLRSLDAGSIRENGVPFIALDAERQDRLLKQARDGRLGSSLLAALSGEEAKVFGAAQMADWIHEVLSQLVELYVADPRTMHRIGFTGFADEGGFTQIRIGEREVFER